MFSFFPLDFKVESGFKGLVGLIGIPQSVLHTSYLRYFIEMTYISEDLKNVNKHLCI